MVHITTLATERDCFNRSVQQVPRGTGTGFVWDNNGHIVTNFHVIQEGSGARVTLADQSCGPATPVGASADRDLAVLKINAPRDKLPAIPVGSSRDLLVGQKVFAIGNPFGLDQTLTVGIVSALNREIASANQRTIRGVIQTDAAINPGNSGGPLLDSAGRLIGINTAIYSPSGASTSIGFAIPVDEVNRTVPRLIRDGRITRPTLGVASANDGLRRALRAPEGVALVQVAPGGPRRPAGLGPHRTHYGSVIWLGHLGGGQQRGLGRQQAAVGAAVPGESALGLALGVQPEGGVAVELVQRGRAAQAGLVEIGAAQRQQHPLGVGMAALLDVTGGACLAAAGREPDFIEQRFADGDAVGLGGRGWRGRGCGTGAGAGRSVGAGHAVSAGADAAAGRQQSQQRQHWRQG